jgi:hypothetical protein
MGDESELRTWLGVPRMLWVVYINTAMYAACYAMQAPALPYLVKSFGHDALSYGYLETGKLICFTVLSTDFLITFFVSEIGLVM